MFRDEHTHPPRLSDDEKRTLFRQQPTPPHASLQPCLTPDTTQRVLGAGDGVVVVKNVLSRVAVERALDAIAELQTQNPGQPGIGSRAEEILDLYTTSVMREIVNEAMGPHTQPVVGFLAVGMGPQPRDTPAQGHVDGGWSGLSPVSHSDILASGQTLETWDIGDPESMGPAGGAPFWQDPEGQRLAIGSFTAFCGVCLNDQRAPGKGQFAVQLGAHEAVEAFFKMQRDAGGPLGGGGPHWPRLVPAGEDGATAGQMPAAMVATCALVPPIPSTPDYSTPTPTTPPA